MKKIVIWVVALAFSMGLAGLAFADEKIIIDEHKTTKPKAGGGVVIDNDGVDVNIRIQPKSDSHTRRTIIRRGPVRSYTKHRNGKPCDAPCSTEYCYPADHYCAHCNQYKIPPCP